MTNIRHELAVAIKKLVYFGRGEPYRHILWEYWTAENSDGFHNPELARESLTKSVDESQKGIKIINDAMAPKTAAAH